MTAPTTAASRQSRYSATDVAIGNWFQALDYLNIATCYDPDQGGCAGSYYLPSSMDPNNQTRSDARRAYHDIAAGRPNYHVIANAQVSRVLFDGNSARAGQFLHAIGVEVGSPVGDADLILTVT